MARESSDNGVCEYFLRLDVRIISIYLTRMRDESRWTTACRKLVVVVGGFPETPKTIRILMVSKFEILLHYIQFYVYSITTIIRLHHTP
jgi:hypothetical protein